MRDGIISRRYLSRFNVRVYSTEPPEDLVVRLGHFLLLGNIICYYIQLHNITNHHIL